jgi:hypothetical protein
VLSHYVPRPVGFGRGAATKSWPTMTIPFQPALQKEPTPRCASYSAKPTAFQTPSSSNSRYTRYTIPALS